MALLSLLLGDSVGRVLLIAHEKLCHLILLVTNGHSGNVRSAVNVKPECSIVCGTTDSQYELKSSAHGNAFTVPPA